MNAGQKISNGKAYEVTIQKRLAPVTDESGFDTEEVWEDYYTNYAYINNLSGNERWMAAQIMSDKTVRFEMRWHPQLDSVKPETHRILYAGDIYTITFVDNVQHKNETVKIEALIVEA